MKIVANTEYGRIVQAQGSAREPIVAAMLAQITQDLEVVAQIQTPAVRTVLEHILTRQRRIIRVIAKG